MQMMSGRTARAGGASESESCRGPRPRPRRTGEALRVHARARESRRVARRGERGVGGGRTRSEVVGARPHKKRCAYAARRPPGVRRACMSHVPDIPGLCEPESWRIQSQRGSARAHLRPQWLNE